MALLKVNDKAPPRWLGLARVSAGIVAGIAYFEAMRRILQRSDLTELRAEALGAGILVAMAFSARIQLRRSTSPGWFTRFEFESFGSFIDHANKHTPLAHLVRLGVVGLAIALFFDLGVVAFVATGDPEHLLPLSILTAIVFNVLAMFAVYKIVRKRRLEREGLRER